MPGGVSTLGEEAFVATLGGVVEHSPWVARAACRRRPFADVGELSDAFEAAMRDGAARASARAHPRPPGAGRPRGARALTAESAREQARPGWTG